MTWISPHADQACGLFRADAHPGAGVAGGHGGPRPGSHRQDGIRQDLRLPAAQHAAHQRHPQGGADSWLLLLCAALPRFQNLTVYCYHDNASTSPCSTGAETDLWNFELGTALHIRNLVCLTLCRIRARDRRCWCWRRRESWRCRSRTRPTSSATPLASATRAPFDVSPS